MIFFSGWIVTRHPIVGVIAIIASIVFVAISYNAYGNRGVKVSLIIVAISYGVALIALLAMYIYFYSPLIQYLLKENDRYSFSLGIYYRSFFPPFEPEILNYNGTDYNLYTVAKTIKAFNWAPAICYFLAVVSNGFILSKSPINVTDNETIAKKIALSTIASIAAYVVIVLLLRAFATIIFLILIIGVGFGWLKATAFD
ncbi:MAG: hypothetical protein LBO63_05605 [Oscillospiraceae bacterium]|jgi:hypothetical protein|nr:hypothetical protein [Oscillospiraceae bacterium]